jgi:hypothetical protein
LRQTEYRIPGNTAAAFCHGFIHGSVMDNMTLS